MKRLINVIKILAQLVFVVPIIVFIFSEDYEQYVYKKENPKLFDHSLYDKPSIEELSVIFDEVTKNLPPPRHEDQFKKTVLVSIIRNYDELEPITIQTLIENIENTHGWKKIESTSNDDIIYCNGQLELELYVDNKNDYQDADSLGMMIGWYDVGICRKLYFNIQPEEW